MFLQTSGGAFDRLDPNAFDAVVLYGSHQHLQTLFSSILRASPTMNASFSSAFLRCGVTQWLSSQPTIDTIRAMREASSTPIILMFEPFYSVRFRDRLPEGSSISVELRDMVFGALRQVVEEAGAVCLFQPEETIVETIYSPHELAIGSRRLAGGANAEHDEDDVTHLNSTYGAIALSRISEALPRC